MTQSNHTQPHLDFYQQVEEFVICSVAADTTGDHHKNNEIGMFLLF